MKKCIRRIIILLLVLAVSYQFICIDKLAKEVKGFFENIFETVEPKPDFETYKNATVELKVGKSGGAGVIVKIDNKYLYVLTANHIVKVKGKVTVQIRTKNGKRIKVDNINRKNIYHDKKVDLALLKIPISIGEFDILPISKREIKQGDKVYTIGHPLNFHYTVTEGIVSNFVKRHYNNRKVDYLMISAPSFGGNSGGAVVNTRGELIGIVVGIMYVGKNPKKLDKTIFLFHMTFAVKVEDMNRLLEEIT